MSRILLVEPDAVLARSHQRALELMGWDVAVAGTAQTAIHSADTQQPDLVILEMQLMSHSGLEFLYEFRSYDDWQAIPVIICSQVPPGEFAATQALLRSELGIVEYLYKPRTNIRRLQSAVREFVTMKA